MKIFVYEYITATIDDMNSSLYREGRAMRDALEADLQAIDNVELLSFQKPKTFEYHLQDCDAVWLIAPEFDGILTGLAQQVENSGKKLISPSSEAIHQTTNKLNMARFWEKQKINTPKTIPFSELAKSQLTYPLVLKPIDGAGSTATTYLKNSNDIPKGIQQAYQAGYTEERMIVQEYIPGQAASIAFVVNEDGSMRALPACLQYISPEDGFIYHGGETTITDNFAKRAEKIGLSALNGIKGLRGYVGVDLLLSSVSPEFDAVIEINPRLTTSYIGLRQTVLGNIAEWVVNGCSEVFTKHGIVKWNMS